MHICDTETFNTIKCVRYANCIIKFIKFSGEYNGGITKRDYGKCRKDCIVFKGLDDVKERLDYVLQFKEESKRIKLKFLNGIFF